MTAPATDQITNKIIVKAMIFKQMKRAILSFIILCLHIELNWLFYSLGAGSPELENYSSGLPVPL
jgi:hypothetical protein